MTPPTLPTCPHDVTLPPDPADPGFCPLCLRALLAEARAEVARLRALVPKPPCPKCRGLGYFPEVSRGGHDSVAITSVPCDCGARAVMRFVGETVSPLPEVIEP